MSRRIRAVATVAETDGPLGLAADVADELDADAAVRVLDGAGGSAVRQAEVDGTVDAGTVRVGADVAGELDVDGGSVVLLESVSTTPAEAVTFAPVPRLSLAGGGPTVRAAVGGRPLSVGDELDVSFLDGSLSVPLRVTETAPPGPVVVADGTTVELLDGPAPTTEQGRIRPVAAAAVGGYGPTIEELDAAVVAPLVEDERFDALGGTNRAGVLVSGPAGVGKSHLLGHAAWRASATVHSVDARALPPGDADAVADRLQEAGAAVSGYDPGVIHLDGLDDFLGDAADDPGAARLRGWLRGFVDEPGVVVVAEARDVEDVPESFLRGELLARTVRVDRPTDDDRGDILATVTRETPVHSSVGDVAERRLNLLARRVTLVGRHLAVVDVVGEVRTRPRERAVRRVRLRERRQRRPRGHHRRRVVVVV